MTTLPPLADLERELLTIVHRRRALQDSVTLAASAAAAA